MEGFSLAVGFITGASFGALLVAALVHFLFLRPWT